MTLFWSGGLLLLSLTLPGAAGSGLCIATTLLYATAFRRLSIKLLIERVRLPLIFALLATATLPVELDWNGHGPRLFLASGKTFETVFLVLLRSSSAILAMGVLFLTERIEGILAALARLGVPMAIVELAHLVYATIHDLMTALESMEIASEARLGFSSLRNRIRTAGLMASGLWLRALLTARRKQQGLSTRDLESFHFVSSVEIPRLTVSQAIAVTVALAAIASLSLTLEALAT
jgi:cobalt/nickel transport system permease protein